MRQDPNAVPHPRASCEQISYHQDQDQQAPAQQPKAWQSPVSQSPAWQPPNQQQPYRSAPYRQAPPIYPAAQRPRPGDQETEATLASIRAARRKAKRMRVVCVLLAACTAAIFLAAAISHQLDAHVEMLTPVLLLTSAVNFRSYGQRVAKYRAAEADILTRVR